MSDKEPTLKPCPLCITGLAPTADVDKYVEDKAKLSVLSTEVLSLKKDVKKAGRNARMSWWSEHGKDLFGAVCCVALVLGLGMQATTCHKAELADEAADKAARYPECIEKSGTERCLCYRERATQLDIDKQCSWGAVSRTPCDEARDTAIACEALLTGTKP